jgi:hypothetical protein
MQGNYVPRYKETIEKNSGNISKTKGVAWNRSIRLIYDFL